MRLCYQLGFDFRGVINMAHVPFPFCQISRQQRCQQHLQTCVRLGESVFLTRRWNVFERGSRNLLINS